MSECEAYQENISALLDGELSEEEMQALRVHVECCPDCRAVFAAFSAVEDAMPDVFPEAPAGLHAHILSGVRAAASGQTPQSQQRDQSRRGEADEQRRAERRVSPRRFRAAAIAAACLVLVITGAALSGRFFRMGRTGAGSNTSSEMLSGSSQAADAGGTEGGVVMDTTTAEEEIAADEAPADDAAMDTAAAEDARQRLEGIAYLTAFADNGTYEGADAVAVADEFFESGPTNKVLNLSITTLPDGETQSVQLWYRGEKAVCSLNEDGVEVGSLDELLAYFRT